jgi:N-acyl-D-amino-acid deacylase
MFDLLITGGLVYDGCGAAPVPADLGITGGRIAAVGRLEGAQAARTLSVPGMAVSPGFIDAHSHADLSLLTAPDAEPKLRQGVTTELVGQCGLGTAPTTPDTVEAWRKSLVGVLGSQPEQWPWPTFAAYLEDLAKSRPGLNVAALVTHGAVRAAVVGLENRAPTPDELTAMGKTIESALEDGAFGMSTGLVYLPCVFADREELVALYRHVAARDSLMFIHIRSQGNQVLEALNEALGIAAESGVSLQVSHLCAVGRPNWGKPARMLEAIDRARAAGQDVTFDQHPYDAGSTALTQVLPAWAGAGGNEALIKRLQDGPTRERLKRAFAEDLPSPDPRMPWQNFVGLVGWENIVVTAVAGEANARYLGQSIAEIAASRREEPADAAFDLLVEEGGKVTMVIMNAYHPEDLATIMRHPAGMIGSDSIYTGNPHPRLYGTFPRVLGRFAREDGAISLSEAVRRTTSAPADRLGLKDRGAIREGLAADLVVFDPATVRDRATYGNPRQFPVGIEHVVVNGQLAVEHGALTGIRAGRVLTR